MQPHVQFKAGKMTRDASDLVTADPRKGMFQIVTSAEDSLVHLQWRPRPGTEIDIDLIIFPGDATMDRVRSTSARVYVLKWVGASTRMFFWMQDADESKDETLINQVNNILRNGPQQSSAEENTISSPPAAERHPAPPSSAQQSSTPETTSAPPATQANAQPQNATASSAALTLESFNDIMESLSSVRNAAQLEEMRAQQAAMPDVLDLLQADATTSALQDPGVQERLSKLLEHVPEHDRDINIIPELLRCGPVRSQAAALSQAIRAGHADEILRSFGLHPESGTLGLNALISALRKIQNESGCGKRPNSEESKKEPPKTD